MRPFITLLLAIFTSTTIPLISNAAPPDGAHPLSGTLDMQVGEDGKDPYKIGQTSAVSFMTGLQEKITGLKAGNVSSMERPKDSAINHLTGIYLYCTLTKGACPEVLDALLETDLINSRISKKAECPSMLSFWRDWQGNDFEARQKFLVRIGNLGITGNFTRNVRPKYIKCQETITQQIAGGGSDAEYFKNRYGSPSSPEANIKKASDYINMIAKHSSNIFYEIEHMQK